MIHRAFLLTPPGAASGHRHALAAGHPPPVTDDRPRLEGGRLARRAAMLYRAGMNRSASVSRQTKETSIEVTVAIDGSGAYAVSTGIGFLDHMIEQLSRHSLIDIDLKAAGDLHIDGHHTTEDCGIALGEAFAQALGDRKGITRYGDALIPMDETLTRVALDISGRPYLVWRSGFSQPRLGTLDTEMFKEFFAAFAGAAGITLHIETLYGVNNHHIAESCFKGLARALKTAVAIDPRQPGSVPSTKGTLGGTRGGALGGMPGADDAGG